MNKQEQEQELIDFLTPDPRLTPTMNLIGDLFTKAQRRKLKIKNVNWKNSEDCLKDYKDRKLTIIASVIMIIIGISILFFGNRSHTHMNMDFILGIGLLSAGLITIILLKKFKMNSHYVFLAKSWTPVQKRIIRWGIENRFKEIKSLQPNKSDSFILYECFDFILREYARDILMYEKKCLFEKKMVLRKNMSHVADIANLFGYSPNFKTYFESV